MSDETTEKRIAEILANQNSLLEAQVKLEENLRNKRNENLTRLGEERAQVEQRLAFEQERLKALAEASMLTKKQREDRAASLKLQKLELEKQLAGYSDESKRESAAALHLREKIDSLDESLKLNLEILELTDEELELFLERVKQAEKKAKLDKGAVESNQLLLESTKGLLGAATGISDEWKRGNTFTSAMLSSMSANMEAGKSLGESFKAMADSLKETYTAQNIGASLIMGVVKSTKSLITEQDQAIAQFKSVTGLSGEYTQSLVDVEESMRHLGATTGDVADAFGTMTEANSAFVYENKQVRDSLLNTSVAMDMALDAGTEFNHTMGTLQSTLGMTAGQATDAALDIAGAAKALGQPPKEMLADFAALGPQLAAWGPNTKKVFLETAAAAKALNMQTAEMLDIASQFDTFSDAADRVGQLNAALGGDYFDTVEMVMATESERIDLIISGIDATGKSFSEMGRFEQKRLAEAAGMTVEQLAKIGNGNRELYTELQELQKGGTMTYNDLSAAAQANMTVQEQLAAIQQSLAISMRPVVELTAKFLGYIQTMFSWLDGWVGIIALATGVIAFLGVKLALLATSLGLIGPAAGSAAAGVVGSSRSIGSAVMAMARGVGRAFMTLSTSIATGLGTLGTGLAGLAAAGSAAIPLLLTIALVFAGLALSTLAVGWAISSIIDSVSNLISSTLAGLENVSKLADFDLVGVALGFGAIATAVGLLALALVSLGVGMPALLGLSLVFGAIAVSAAAVGWAISTVIDSVSTLVSSTAAGMKNVSALADFDLAGVASDFDSIARTLGLVALALIALAPGLPGLVIFTKLFSVLAVAAAVAGYAIGGIVDSVSNLANSTSAGMDNVSKLANFDLIKVADGFMTIADSIAALGSSLSALDLSVLDKLSTIDTAVTPLLAVKETLVTATTITPENVENMKLVTDQIIRLTTDKSAGAGSAQLQTIREIIKETGSSASAGASTSPGLTEVTLQIDGQSFGKIMIPKVMKEINKIVKSKMSTV